MKKFTFILSLACLFWSQAQATTTEYAFDVNTCYERNKLLFTRGSLKVTIVRNADNLIESCHVELSAGGAKHPFLDLTFSNIPGGRNYRTDPKFLHIEDRHCDVWGKLAESRDSSEWPTFGMRMKDFYDDIHFDYDGPYGSGHKEQAHFNTGGIGTVEVSKYNDAWIEFIAEPQYRPTIRCDLANPIEQCSRLLEAGSGLAP